MAADTAPEADDTVGVQEGRASGTHERRAATGDRLRSVFYIPRSRRPGRSGAERQTMTVTKNPLSSTVPWATLRIRPVKLTFLCGFGATFERHTSNRQTLAKRKEIPATIHTRFKPITRSLVLAVRMFISDFRDHSLNSFESQESRVDSRESIVERRKSHRLESYK